MTSRKLQALVLTAALVCGYAGAAAYTAWAGPSVPPPVPATDFGPGDGLTRYVVTAASGGDQAALLPDLAAIDGVAHAQPLDGARALVAVDDVPVDALAAVPGVGGVERSTTVPVLGQVTDPYFPQYGWNLENTGANSYNQPVPATADADVDATAGWDSGTGAGRIVAVVDTGFDSDHPDLVGSLWTNPDESCGSTDRDGNGLAGDCHGWNFYTNSADVDNGSMGSHGTSVAGVVGARASNGVGSAGVAPGATLMPLVIGGGDSVDVNMGARAIRYAVDHGADVITASWGGTFTGSALQGLKDAVAYAAMHDVPIVAAAGNDPVNRDFDLMYPASLEDANIITVGSSTAGDTVSPTSGYGTKNVDLFAPGFLVLTTWNDGGYRLVGGTSIAGPHVAAAYVLYRAQNPGLGSAAIKEALMTSADKIPAFAGRSASGGRLTLSHLAAPEPVRYAFTSMTAPAGTVSPEIGMSSSEPAGAYSVALGLGMEHEGEIWALADKPVTLGGSTVPTDDTGSAVFDLGALSRPDGLGLSPSMPLANGRYVLTVQLLRDGKPVGRAAAAPLLVRDAAAGGTTPTPGGSTSPSTPPSSTPRPTTAPAPTTSPRPTTTAPRPTTTAPRPTTTAPRPTTTSPRPTTTAPRPTPTAPEPSPVPQPNPVSPPPIITVPGSPQPTPVTEPPSAAPRPGTPTPTPGAGSTTPPTTPGENTTTYPSVGDFRITSLSPNTVSVDGGTLVTVTGTALPPDPSVLVGGAARATVVRATTTRLQFRVPARVAGVYDVTVFAPDGRSTELEKALTYRSDAPAGTDPGAGPTPGGGTAPPPVGTVPTPTTTPTSPGAGTVPVERTGPNGERLVRSASFDALRGIWSLDCSSSCTGIAI